jgi:hypothetical protein
MARCNECCQSNGTHSDACFTGRERRERKPTDRQIKALGDLGRTKRGRAIISDHRDAIISLMMR